jgi:anti-sigma factor RsiW
MTNLIENDAVREWLGAYLDGELNAERRAWVQYHLARCAMCRHELEELRNLSSLLHADPLPVSQCSADQFFE